MNVIRPIVGEWYRGGTNELFEVVAIDDQDQTIEIQYFDGTVAEMDFDSWNEHLLGRSDRGRGCAGRLVGRHRCRGRRPGPRVRGQRQNGVVQSARPLDAPLSKPLAARFACSAPLAFRGCRAPRALEAADAKSPARSAPAPPSGRSPQKNSASPMWETSVPAMAPVVTRGMDAMAESSAYCVALKLELHSDMRNATNAAWPMPPTPVSSVVASASSQSFLAGQRQPHVQQIGERLTDAENQQRAEHAPAHVDPAAEGHADDGGHRHVRLAGDAELVERESDALDHEGAVQAQGKSVARLVEQHQQQKSPCAFLTDQVAQRVPYRIGQVRRRLARRQGSGAQNVDSMVAAMSTAMTRNASVPTGVARR